MITEVNITGNKRNYLFDNYRAILIFCVVLGHMLRRKLGEIAALDTIYNFVYFFHMPAFVFVTGYFSKNTKKSRDKAVQSFFIPYIIFNTAFWLEDRISTGGSLRGYHIFNTEWGLWFLLAVFVWKLLLKDLVRIRYILPISFIVGLLAGFSEEFSTKMALSRIIAFFPFFLLGYYCKESYITYLRKIPRIITAIALFGSYFLANLTVKYDLIKKGSLYMWKPYSKVNEKIFSDILIRGAIYIIAIIMMVCLINLVSSKKSWFSIIGQNSITVYIFHLYLVSKLRILTASWDANLRFILFSVAVSIAITYFCSRPIVVKVYNYIMNKINRIIFKY